MAETINEHFANIAQVLAEGIPAIDAEFYLETTDKSCSLQTQSIDIVLNRKKIDDKRATGLDKIPSKLLKTAASIIAPSLTNIFSKSILTLLEATDDRSVNIDNGLLNGVVFIDLTKEFDTIDHEIILYI